MLAEAVAIDEKLCRVCGEYYPLSAFYKRNATQYASSCKACESARRKEVLDGEREVRRHEMEWVGDRGYAYLGLAIIRQAVMEWRHGKHTHELILFFRSQTFELMCDGAGLHPDWVRASISSKL